MPNNTAATSCPTSLAVLFRPRLRCRRTLIRSSRKPTTPSTSGKAISKVLLLPPAAERAGRAAEIVIALYSPVVMSPRGVARASRKYAWTVTVTSQTTGFV